MTNNKEVTTVYSGKHLSMVARGNWEYATRKTNRPAVGIVALTDDDKVVLVEQFRTPVDRSVIELPAGLAGDITGKENEPLVEAAKRELLEETGYTAKHWTSLGSGYSSPGLTDESIEFFLATGLQKQGAGGGDESEDITVHEIALDDLPIWLESNQTNIDLKLLAGVYMAQQNITRQESK